MYGIVTQRLPPRLKPWLKEETRPDHLVLAFSSGVGRKPLGRRQAGAKDWLQQGGPDVGVDRGPGVTSLCVVRTLLADSSERTL